MADEEAAPLTTLLLTIRPESRSRHHGHPVHTGLAGECSTGPQLRLRGPQKPQAVPVTVGVHRPVWLADPRAPGEPPGPGFPKRQGRVSEWLHPGSPWRAAAGAGSAAAGPVAPRPSPGP